MARQPSQEEPDVLNEEEIKQLRHSLAHLSPDGVRQFYKRAFEDCRLIYNRLPSHEKYRRSLRFGSNCGNGDSSHDLGRLLEAANLS
jgi:hypothetical protein